MFPNCNWLLHTFPSYKQYSYFFNAIWVASILGLACAVSAAERGHSVDLFDKAAIIGGQFNYAKLIPGKEEFYETLRYFKRRLQHTGVVIHLGKEVAVNDLLTGGYHSVVLATGVTPRAIKLPNTSTVSNGQHSVNVVSYVDVLSRKASVGNRRVLTT
jgi:2,4-dienoyl-CoA reductase (NADPH2)